MASVSKPGATQNAHLALRRRLATRAAAESIHPRTTRPSHTAYPTSMLRDDHCRHSSVVHHAYAGPDNAPPAAARASLHSPSVNRPNVGQPSTVTRSCDRIAQRRDTDGDENGCQRQDGVVGRWEVRLVGQHGHEVSRPDACPGADARQAEPEHAAIPIVPYMRPVVAWAKIRKDANAATAQITAARTTSRKSCSVTRHVSTRYIRGPQAAATSCAIFLKNVLSSSKSSHKGFTLTFGSQTIAQPAER